LVTAVEGVAIVHKVSFPAFIPFAIRYFSVMDISYLSSFSEGMPNLIMKASAVGLSIVSTNCGHSVELIDQGGTV